MNLTLKRFADTPDGVFGVIDLPGLRLWTLEDDWLGNLPGVSCIPTGLYTCVRDTWHAKGIPVFHITNVPHRERILIHYGNTEEDVKGCVVLGMDRGCLKVKDEDGGGERLKWAVTQSREAFQRFMVALDGVQSFSLSVEWAVGTWRG